MRRIGPRPGEVIDRTRPVRFTWNGKPYEGCEGDTIGSALAAAGVRVVSRSFKYHRPRGILAAGYHDPNLMVQVGDEPNVRAGHRLVADGMDVTAQNAWPSLRFDVRSANRLVGRFLGPGFYYKTFIGPDRLVPWYQRTLRRFSSGGRVPAEPPFHPPEKRYAHPDVLVAGGGPAGMAAAVAAAEAGAAVMLVQEEHHLGGHLRYGDATNLAALAELRDRVAAAGVEVLTDSVAAGRFDHNWVGVVERGGGERLVKVRAKMLVVAAGTIERPYVFAGNDLPGVMLSTAARRLVNLWAVAPGTRAVVATGNESGHAAAGDLVSAGLDVTVVDARRLDRARGRGAVERVQLDDGTSLDADLLVTAVGWTTSTALLNMAGSVPEYDPVAARFLPGELPGDVLATGGLVGDGSTDELVAHGEATGREAARRALATAARWQAATPRAVPVEHEDRPAEPVPSLPPAPHPELFAGPTDGFVDFSEDVKASDLAAAAAEGYDSIELSKRYTTATMGPVQGKLEVVNAVAVHARATGSTIAETGTTTWRPPYAPITLGALAGRDEDPVRRSPLHDWHAGHGAEWLVAGQWLRPDHYGDPAAEVRATRAGVGIVDVSPLGKIDLRGGHVPKLLDLVYTNRWGRLDVGRVRYGIMCAEDGVVMDDGVTARLADERWYMTTTSGGAGRVWNWLDDWLQTGFPHWQVRMTAVSDGYAAMNVAGPGSRELLASLTDVDVGPGAFPYMHAREGTVAGVAGCLLLRIGFTGELSYEVHVPAGHGLHVWEALVEAGAAPFGIEAQRIMRLEKGHFIVGQDTDGLTKAGAAGAGWAVKLAKPDFVGRPELAWEADAGPSRVLVALQPADAGLVPPEASQIIEGDRIVGRVTSSRMSPTLGRGVCLAQLDAGLVAGGERVTIRTPDGGDHVAIVLDHHAHLDPEGERLRA